MWTAISLWILNVGGLVAYAWLASRAIGSGGRPIVWILGAPALYFAIVLVLCLLYFTVAWLWRARRPHDVQIGARATLRLFWHEYRALAGAAPRMMLYRLLVPDAAAVPTAVPVLLVHGVLCNAGVWARLRRDLRRRGVGGFFSLSYGPPLASIEEFADQLARKIDAVLAATGATSTIIVAHSMGGLVVRAYIRRYGIAKL